MIVLPALAAHAARIGVIAPRTEDAVLAGAAGRPVSTVLIDTSSPVDPTVHLRFTSCGLRAPHRVLPRPGANWGTAVEHGLRHAQQTGAETVVVADPEVPADLDASAPASRLAAGMGRLVEQPRQGAVCCPLAAPWWRRLLAIHVLRPLCAPTLGFLLLDPQARTLVLSAEAVTAALTRRSMLVDMGWSHGHGLGIVAAARHAGLDIGQTLPRLPVLDAQETWEARPVLDAAEVLGLVKAALRLAPLEPARPGTPVPPWVSDLGLGRCPRTVLNDLLAWRAAEPRPRSDSGAAGWPDPLIAAWHGARDLNPDLDVLAKRVWLAFVARLGPWLFATASTGYTGQARTSVIAAARAFLAATSTASDDAGRGETT
ncbi:hypothetical protein [Amycolatopsis aidingensis]|uniref:hypothetical protein n=1 Tax=Amycolatopsis aidingensis TaxID=2842453 RepID=UPI001C0E87A7|nr:hypothetical protein [Amycolatopsis aidingensis]